MQFTAAEQSEYTGVFQGGSGFIRMSLAKDYSDSNITPGFSIKFMRDQQPSCNFVAMPSLDGQTSKNFFEGVFTNHPAYPTGFALQLLTKKFKQASNCALQVGLKDCAQWNTAGIEESNIAFP